jgi:hypothetical protein
MARTRSRLSASRRRPPTSLGKSRVVSARQMVARCRRYLEEPPARGWNGVHRVAEK